VIGVFQITARLTADLPRRVQPVRVEANC